MMVLSPCHPFAVSAGRWRSGLSLFCHRGRVPTFLSSVCHPPWSRRCWWRVGVDGVARSPL